MREAKRHPNLMILPVASFIAAGLKDHSWINEISAVETTPKVVEEKEKQISLMTRLESKEP